MVGVLDIVGAFCGVNGASLVCSDVIVLFIPDLEQRGDGGQEPGEGRFLVGSGNIGDRDAGSGHGRGDGIGEHRLGLAQVGDLIHESPLTGLLCVEPAALLHQIEEVGLGLAALGGIH